MPESTEDKSLPRGWKPGAENDNETGRTGSIQAKKAGQTQGWQLVITVMGQVSGQAEKRSPDQWSWWHGCDRAGNWYSSDFAWARTKSPGLRSTGILVCSSFNPTKWVHSKENVRVIDNGRFICLNISSILVPSPVWGIKWWPFRPVPFPEWATMF